MGDSGILIIMGLFLFFYACFFALAIFLDRHKRENRKEPPGETITTYRLTEYPYTSWTVKSKK